MHTPSFRKWSLSLLFGLAFAAGARGEAMLELFNVNWSDLIKKMPEIAEAGYTALWLPPPTKGSSVFSIGYDSFDPFDLGDKNQRGTIATRWGTKDQLIQVVLTAHQFGIRVYFDNIMNHRAFDVPGYNSSTPTNLYPGLLPKDFHLQTVSGGFYANWPGVQDYNNQWDVQYESLSGLVDLATEPGSINGNFGPTLGSTTPKISFIRHPNNPEYYLNTNALSIGGGWFPFYTTNGFPVADDVNAYLIRAVMWTLWTTKCDGFRLDAVKHVPSPFFGASSASPQTDENTFAGYTGGIQAMFDYVHGYGNNLLGNGYVESDGNRNSCFDSEAPRNDALLFGEHLGQPPSYIEYINNGMRLLNTPMRSAVDSWAGGGSGSGLDGRDIGSFTASEGVQFAQDQDHSLCCVAHRELHNAYYFMHEGIPMIYSDGYNFAGTPSDPNTFPIVPLANYLGQFGDNQMPDICYLHHQLARGGTRSRWSDSNIIAWERYDYREVASDPYNNPDATVLFFAVNNKTSFPGDVIFDDGIVRTADGYYTCNNGSPSRGVAMRVGFPPGSVLSQLASSSPGGDRACAKLLVHSATTNASLASASANASYAPDRLLLVNAPPPPGGGAIEMLVPGGGWVIYGYQWPEASRANVLTNAITFRQGGAVVPTITVFRHDGANGDTNWNPIYPFKMRGSVDPTGAIIGGQHVSNLTYSIDVPLLTNAPFDIAVRSDASAFNILAKMDGGLDLNSQMGLGSTNVADLRDNKPGTATDVYLGYEQAQLQFRNGPEKFAARNVSRNQLTSLGAETYYYTVGGGTNVVNGGGNGNNVNTSTATWVYHDPGSTNSAAGGLGTPTQRIPLSPTSGQTVILWLKVGYGFRTNHCFVYYTSDGSNPEGAYGVGKGATQVVPGTWVTNDTQDTASDWFKATIPASVQTTGVQVRYKAAFYQDNIPSISDADNAKLYGLTQFGVTNFNPTTAAVWLHNDLNPSNTATGLSSGFHILRARSFLPRSTPGNSKSSVYNTFIQTFYYESQLPGGVVAFPATDGATLGSSTYQFVVRADSSVTGMDFNIQDSDPSNDDSFTGLANGNGNNTNSQISFVSAAAVTPDPTLSQQYPNYPQEFRFNYVAIPTNGTATITIHLKTLSTSVYPNRFTALTRTVNTRGPATVLYFSNPASDGATAVVASNAVYTIQACFTPTLDTNNVNLFSLYINGVFQPRSGYALRPVGAVGGCPGLRSFSYNWTNTQPNALPGTNLLQLLFTNQISLSAARSIELGTLYSPLDSDGDGMPDWMELIAGTDPYDPNSNLRVLSVDGGGQTIVWNSVSNINYQLLATTNLSAPMIPLGPVIRAAGPLIFFSDPFPDPAQKFYRVQVVP